VDAEDKRASSGWVRRERLTDVANRVRDYNTCRVNNLQSSAILSDHSRSVSQILTDAVEMIDQRVEYSFLGKNCEYYATKWRYGRGFSGQVEQGREMAEGLTRRFPSPANILSPLTSFFFK